jgi:integrase
MKIKFSKTSIEAIKVIKNKDFFVSDAITTGLYIRVRPSGRKTFYAIYRLANRRRQKISMGDFPIMSVEEARDKSQELLKSAAEGNNPITQKRAESGPALSATIKDLYEKYMDEHAIHKKASSVRNDVVYWKKHILPKIGNKYVCEITCGDISKIHKEIAKEVNLKGQFKTVTANRVLEVLKKAFNLAEDWEWRPEGSNPCRKTKKFIERPRRRYLSVQECISLYKVLQNYLQNENYHARQTANLVLLLLYTGARRGELLTAKWSYIFPERGVLALPDSKANRPQDIQLSNEAMGVLEQIRTDQQKNGTVGEYIFDGHIKGQHLKDEGRQWDNIRIQAGLVDFRMHDLRHSFASFMAMTTGSQLMIKEALRHSDSKTSERYTHLFNDPLRLAVGQTTAKLHEVMSGGKVIDFNDVKKKREVI